MNKCIFTGRITKDPEVKYTTTGKPVVMFNIAVDKQNKDENGNRQADFIPCTAWMTKADFIGKYVKKGNMLSIVGRLESRTYTDKNNQNRVSYEIFVEEVENLSPRDSTSASNPQVSASQQSYPNPQYQAPPHQPTYQAPPVQKTQVQQPVYNPQNFDVEVADDDLPF